MSTWEEEADEPVAVAYIVVEEDETTKPKAENVAEVADTVAGIWDNVVLSTLLTNVLASQDATGSQDATPGKVEAEADMDIPEYDSWEIEIEELNQPGSSLQATPKSRGPLLSLKKEIEELNRAECLLLEATPSRAQREVWNRNMHLASKEN